MIDIDGVDMRNPQAVAQYACDIYNYYKEVEGIYHPQDYMGSQVSETAAGSLCRFGL